MELSENALCCLNSSWSQLPFIQQRVIEIQFESPLQMDVVKSKPTAKPLFFPSLV